MQILKVISVLLSYPRRETLAALSELRAVLHEDDLPETTRRMLCAFVDMFASTDLMTLEERYVELFDRGRRLSLHLFEHVHGESRTRGQAMADLLDLYQRHGFELATPELPDYLPLFLEYLSMRPRAEAFALVRDAMPILTLIGARLKERGSEYALLFDALEALAGAPADAQTIRAGVADEGGDETLEHMDRIWEEEAVTFLAPAACATNADVQPLRWVTRGKSG